MHDGEKLVHEPLRLTVAVEAPKEAISDILQRHPQVSALFDHGWLSLITIDDQGQIAWRYRNGGTWEKMDGGEKEALSRRLAS